MFTFKSRRQDNLQTGCGFGCNFLHTPAVEKKKLCANLKIWCFTNVSDILAGRWLLHWFSKRERAESKGKGVADESLPLGRSFPLFRNVAVSCVKPSFVSRWFMRVTGQLPLRECTFGRVRFLLKLSKSRRASRFVDYFIFVRSGGGAIKDEHQPASRCGVTFSCFFFW